MCNAPSPESYVSHTGCTGRYRFCTLPDKQIYRGPIVASKSDGLLYSNIQYISVYYGILWYVMFLCLSQSKENRGQPSGTAKLQNCDSAFRPFWLLWHFAIPMRPFHSTNPTTASPLSARTDRLSRSECRVAKFQPRLFPDFFCRTSGMNTIKKQTSQSPSCIRSFLIDNSLAWDGLAHHVVNKLLPSILCCGVCWQRSCRVLSEPNLTRARNNLNQFNNVKHVESKSGFKQIWAYAASNDASTVCVSVTRSPTVIGSKGLTTLSPFLQQMEADWMLL